MNVVRTVADLPHLVDGRKALVPTMGAFHQGHLDLMRVGRAACDWLTVSLFVNPTQFVAGEDLDRYPRNFDRDAEMAEGCGVDVLFAPAVEEVYPRSPASVIHVPDVSERWEGAVRPGHFGGVATVVGKLFNMVRPDVAYFGQKDLQQTVVLGRMVEDLNFPVRIEVCPTTRETDGLAMSSRNVYLSPEERRIAPRIFSELTRVAEDLRHDARSSRDARTRLVAARNALTDAGFSVDYFELVDREALMPLLGNGDEAIDPTPLCLKDAALIAAARLGRTRLIDNVLL